MFLEMSRHSRQPLEVASIPRAKAKNAFTSDSPALVGANGRECAFVSVVRRPFFCGYYLFFLLADFSFFSLNCRLSLFLYQLKIGSFCFQASAALLLVESFSFLVLQIGYSLS